MIKESNCNGSFYNLKNTFFKLLAMMKSYLIKTVVLLLLFFTACKKDSILFIPNADQQLDSAWVSSPATTAQINQLAAKISGTIFSQEVNLENVTDLKTSTGLTVEFPRNSLLIGTNAVTGTIKTQYALIQKKGDFIRYGIPTVSNKMPLESGGALYLKLSNANGDIISVSPTNSIYIKYPEPEIKTGMSLYYNNVQISNSVLFNWLPSNDGSIVSSWTSPTPPLKGYVIKTSRTGWLNVDRLLEPSLTRTEAGVIMPNLFSNANTAVFMVFKNLNTVVQLIGNADFRKFSHPNIPIQFDVKLVTISKVGDTYYLGTKDERIVPNLLTYIKPDISSLEKINNLLNSL